MFLEKLSAAGMGYLFAGQTEPFTRRLERIRVKNGADFVQEVLGTRHGVVFNSLSQTTRPGEAHVLYDPQTMQSGTTVRAMLAFLTASNWTEFRAAMEHYYDPGLHIVYADDQNNIGYQTLVHRPLTVRRRVWRRKVGRASRKSLDVSRLTKCRICSIPSRASSVTPTTCR